VSGGRPGRAIAFYALASVAAIGLAAAVLVTVYRAPAERGAVGVSALVALAGQMVAFALARLMADRGSGIAGWGLGAALCFAVLVVYGFVGRALELPTSAALVSLATFFFLTELIEPPFLTL
jgi:hypothetical protein